MALSWLHLKVYKYNQCLTSSFWSKKTLKVPPPLMMENSLALKSGSFSRQRIGSSHNQAQSHVYLVESYWLIVLQFLQDLSTTTTFTMPVTQSQQHTSSSADPADTTMEESASAEPIETPEENSMDAITHFRCNTTLGK